ncbi:MAG: hypothetical protein IJW53_03425 [Clostridia bacterium]|nr:hypothetical protein [Clostridia bacterium]
MTNTKSTKRALLVSVMAMVICFTMLLGTTFAWFTSEDKVEGNIISAGTLTVDITGTAISLNNVEPGYVHIQNLTVANTGSLDFNYKLVLERTAAPDTSDGKKDLATVIEVYYVKAATATTADDRTAINELLADETKAKPLGTLASLIDGNADFFGASTLLDKDSTGNSEPITLIFVVPTSVTNDYQGASAGTFTVNVLAAQLASEPDSVNNQYDAGSEYSNGQATSPVNPPVTP